MPSQNYQIELDDLHTGQEIISSERNRFNVLSCGRRWGKTHFTYRLIAEMVQYNLNNGLEEDMGYMSPTYKNLAPTWRRFVKTFNKIITYKSEQNFTAQILGKFMVEFWSLDKPESIRGRQYKRIIVDEAALIAGLKDIFKVILLPTIGDLVGDAWFFSTPRGYNDFYHFWRYGQNPIFMAEGWKSWMMPTSSNPFFPKAELESQRKLIDPDEFAQEWEGKFVSLGNSPFDISKFAKYATMELALDGHAPLHKIRYWDIANSADGDYTASSLLTITEEPRFIISNPIRYKGHWGNTYPLIKQIMLNEPDVMHVFETEGVGGIAWQMIQADPMLFGIKKMPATRVFTMQSKEERTQIWALELQNGRMAMVEDANHLDMLDEIAAFPNGANDDWVDGVSGNFLSFIFFYGGYKKLIDSKKIHPKSTMRQEVSYRKQSLIDELADIY